AYHIPWKQLEGNAQVLNEAFDIDAKPAANAIPVQADSKMRAHLFQLMLQSLLAERFKLALRKETREMPIYILVPAKGGPKLKRSSRECSDDDQCGRQGGGPASGLRLRDAEISRLTEMLSVFMDRQVVDRTGIQGRFDM